jgi:hypothetical protein
VNEWKHRSILLVLLFACVCFLTANISAQTLKEKLATQTNFKPENSSPSEQLIEVAQRFKLPMAIEWLEQTKETKSEVLFNGGSVLELIKAILRQSPEQHLRIEDRILYIYPSSVVSHRFNFLNLRISNYDVKDESVFAAEAELRTKINMIFYPELYKNGYNGGFGGGSPHAFWRRNISFSGTNLTVRDILKRIAEESENALWIVRLRPEEFRGSQPKWRGVPRDESGHAPINSRWRFIALSEERDN